MPSAYFNAMDMLADDERRDTPIVATTRKVR
jgi:hypothetical protein